MLFSCEDSLPHRLVITTQDIGNVAGMNGYCINVQSEYEKLSLLNAIQGLLMFDINSLFGNIGWFCLYGHGFSEKAHPYKTTTNTEASLTKRTTYWLCNV